MRSDFTPVDATFVSDNEGWVLGTFPCETPPTPDPCDLVAHTVDSGRTWESLAGPPAPVRHLRFADAVNGYAFGPSLWRTVDGGHSWSRIAGYDGVSALEVARGTVWLVEETSAYAGAVGDTKLAKVRDLDAVPWGDAPQLAVQGHRAFTTTYQHGHPVLMWSDGRVGDQMPLPCRDDWPPFIAVRDVTTVLVVCAVGEGAGGQEPKRAYLLHLGTRSVDRLSDPDQLSSDFVAASRTAWFIGNHDRVQVSRDGGHSWRTSLGTAGGGVQGPVGFESPRLGFAVADTDLSGVGLYLTHDDGRTWRRADFHRLG